LNSETHIKIDHIAIWARDTERLKNFYVKYFGMTCGKKYVNPSKHYSSYFLSFEGAETRIEIMHRPDIAERTEKQSATVGITHFSIALGSKEQVDSLTERLRSDGFTIVGEPRTTGDGYYESVVEDCEGNWVEITVSI
jgi:lactoylglutathione lyase